jgi:tetratricopeptide (TPR) repeat protein
VTERALALTLACVAWAGRATPQSGSGRCDLRPGHALVSRAIQNLKDAATTAFRDERDRALRDADQELVDALGDRGQATNPAAWYYLGRYYVATTDLAGADSAFGKTVALAPGCTDDVNTWRRMLWVPVMNAGVAAWQAGNPDSAIRAFRAANAIYTAEPTAFNYLATLFASRNEVDSAAAYFALARDATRDERFAADRKDAAFNLARVFHRGGRYRDAVRAYLAYLEDYPTDLAAHAGLAASYLHLGETDSAAVVVAAVLADSDSAAPSDLFAAGEELHDAVSGSSDTARVPPFSPVPADTLATACDSLARALDTTRVAGGRLALAVLRAGLEKNPYDRAALFAAAELAILTRDTSAAESVAARLGEVDPSNQASLGLVARAWDAAGEPDSARRYAALADSLVLDVTVGAVTLSTQGAALSVVVTNRRAVGSPPAVLSVEFLDAAGSVVTSVSVTVPALEARESRAFSVQAMGEGIEAWRYRVEGRP